MLGNPRGLVAKLSDTLIIKESNLEFSFSESWGGTSYEEETPLNIPQQDKDDTFSVSFEQFFQV